MNPPKSPSPRGDTTSAFDSPTFNLDMSIKVDAPVGSMSISPSSRDVVLASRQGLHIVDLDNPYDPPRFLQHLTAWSVADVQWSPHASHSHWVVSTSNQKAIVWNLSLPSRGAIEHVLNSHTRAITDINFSAHQPNILATCSIDSFVHCWDLRTPRRPAVSFCDWFAGATQVKYSRQNENILASSHDKYLYIWDTRMGATAVRKISAHSTKIYGLDWNRTRPSGIATCALDKAVKFWDYEQSPQDTPERVIHTSFPVWRARHTPFGRGMLTMPQRGDTSLYLWDRRTKADCIREPVARFEGHTDHVKEFLWRWRGGEGDGSLDDREFQLVSWGLDKDIRLWSLDKEVLEKVGHDPNKKLRFRVTRRGAAYKTFREEPVIPKESGIGKAPVIGGMRHVPRVTVGLSDGDKEIKSGWRDSLFPHGGHGHGIRSSVVSPAPGSTGLGRQLSMANLSSGGRAVSEVGSSGSKEGGFMRAGRRKKKEINPITWMKGVKIGRRITGSGGESEGSRNAGSVRGGFLGIGWEGPETLADEISLVGVKFPKIAFEKVNVAARTCTLSLTGPWGAENKWVFLRTDVSFPPDYPADGKSLPVFMLEKTNAIPESNLAVIDANLRKIAGSHVGRTRVCLEACLCYLLGEKAEDTVWTGSDDGGEISSSDDEGGMVGLSVRSAEDEEGSAGPTQMNNQANVPLPKACGATWATDGTLLYFFPRKEDRIGSKSLLSSLVVKDGGGVGRSSGKLWEGFGRLNTPITGPRRRRGNWLSEPDPDTSDKSYSTSSNSSSDESDSISGAPLRPSLAWEMQRGAGRSFGRGGSTDRSTQRSMGTGAKTMTGAAVHRTKNVVSIHNLSHLLPAKKELAQEYKIFGDGPGVSRYNAEVAERFGYSELADVWRLVEMVLCNEVPLEVCGQLPGRPTRAGEFGDKILIMARRASFVRGRRDSGLGMGLDSDDELLELEYWGKVKWGSHPLGGRWLVEELFAYFERKADVQMLAMLSCVLCEVGPVDEFEDGGLGAPFREVPLCSKVPRYTLEYFANADLARQNQPRALSISPQRRSISATPIHQGSFGSSNGGNFGGNFGSDPVMPYSTGTTPPLRSFGPTVEDYGFCSMSSSPEQTHNPRRTPGFGAGLARAFGPMTGSPPTRRRPSPAESPLGFTSTTSGVTWGPTTTIGSAGLVVSDPEPTPENPFPVRITMVNMDQFDEEGNVYLPLLDSRKAKLYRSYRENYANLLYVWGLRLQRLEILQFNGLKCAQVDEEGEGDRFGKKNRPVDDWDGLEIGGHCSKCGAILEATKGARGECKGCKRRQMTMTCCICDVVIKGLYGPCLQCGHVAHADCQEAWFSQEDVAECPTGCGCNCLRFVEGGFRFERDSNLPPPPLLAVNARLSKEERPRHVHDGR